MDMKDVITGALDLFQDQKKIREPEVVQENSE